MPTRSRGKPVCRRRFPSAAPPPPPGSSAGRSREQTLAASAPGDADGLGDRACGNSAGGHLVAELLDETSQRQRGLPTGALAGGCAISGLFDLEPVRLSFQNDALSLTRAEVERHSPLRRPYRPCAPVIATVGGDEMEEFLDQNRRFAGLCAGAGAPTLHREEAGMNHITVVLDALAHPGHGLHQALASLMGLSGAGRHAAGG